MTGIIAQLPVFVQPKYEAIKADILPTGIVETFLTFDYVNHYVNAIPYRSDEQGYGVSDYWAKPRDFFRCKAGDCEDYALAKLALCQENGLIHNNGALVLCWDMTRDLAHMVFAVGELILDNQTPTILPALNTHYKFLGKVQL